MGWCVGSAASINAGGTRGGGSQVVRNGAILRQIGGEFHLAAHRVDARPQLTWEGLLAKDSADWNSDTRIGVA